MHSLPSSGDNNPGQAVHPARARSFDVLGEPGTARQRRAPPGLPALTPQLSQVLRDVPTEPELQEMSPAERRDRMLALVGRLVAVFVEAGTEPDPRQAMVLAAAIDALSGNCPLAAYHHCLRITSLMVRGSSPRTKRPQRTVSAELQAALAQLRERVDAAK